MLRLAGEQVESLFDEALAIEVRELPDDLARLEELLSDPGLLAPIAARWDAAAREQGRPTIAMSLLVGLRVVKQRSGWGYRRRALAWGPERRATWSLTGRVRHVVRLTQQAVPVAPLIAWPPGRGALPQRARQLGPEPRTRIR